GTQVIDQASSMYVLPRKVIASKVSWRGTDGLWKWIVSKVRSSVWAVLTARASAWSVLPTPGASTNRGMANPRRATECGALDGRSYTATTGLMVALVSTTM